MSVVEVLVEVWALAAVAVVGGESVGVDERSTSEVMGPMVVCSGCFEFSRVLGFFLTGGGTAGMLELGGPSSREISSSTLVVVGARSLGCLELSGVVRFVVRRGGGLGAAWGADCVPEVFSSSEMVGNNIFNSGCLEFVSLVRFEVCSGTRIKSSAAVPVERVVGADGSAGGLSGSSLASGTLRADIVFSRCLELPGVVRCLRLLDDAVAGRGFVVRAWLVGTEWSWGMISAATSIRGPSSPGSEGCSCLEVARAVRFVERGGADNCVVNGC